MVRKAVGRLGETFGWGAERVNEFFQEKVEPTMMWNRISGNSYTASLWISVAQALKGLKAGERIAAFSYGSGFGSELISLVAGPAAAAGHWAQDMELDLANRKRVDGQAYARMRSSLLAPA